MTCLCDQPIGPSIRTIAPGLPILPHAVNDFSRLRSSMLKSIRAYPALDAWNARSDDDLGVMLLEFFAYIGHTVEFYNWIAANESYLRTALRDETATGLVSLIGYTPRPASPAYAQLAATATGNRTVSVPAGTQFLSGAFDDEPPQLFETETDATISSRSNSWTVRTARDPMLGSGGGLYTKSHLDFEPKRFDADIDDLLLISDSGTPFGTFTVTDIQDAAQADGSPVKRVHFDRPLQLANTTSVTQLSVQKATQQAGLFTRPLDPSGPELLIAVLLPLPEYREFTLDRIRTDLRLGDPVVLSREDDHRWFTTAAIRNVQKTLVPAQTVEVTIEVDDTPATSTSTIPATKIPVTRLTLDADYNNIARRHTGYGPRAPVNGLENYQIRFGFVSAGRVAAAPVMEVRPDTPLDLQSGSDGLIAMPVEPDKPRSYLLSDEFGVAYSVTGTIDTQTGRFVFEETADWPIPLTPPVTIHGNVLDIRRGQSIRSEVLGDGNSALAGQEFQLAKAPVAHVNDLTGATERGFRSTVALWVDGIAWTEVESLATAGPQDSVYLVRQNSDNETSILTGDGVHGRRVPTGQGNVVAHYIFGAGEAAPPPDSVNQIATPVIGLSSVTNPIAASGGADAERFEDIKHNAPSSALLLGRIVSLGDVLAVSRTFPGVTAARADWVWHESLQTAAIQVWCIAAQSVTAALRAKIRNLCEPGMSVSVDTATAVPMRLAMDLVIDPARVSADVEDAVRHHLMTGILSASNIGIGRPLFRSAVFAETMKVDGVVAVPALSADGVAFNVIGLKPDAGGYFDIATGGLVINGRETAHGE